MTIIELLRAECRAKGVPEKHAEKIQKIFNIEKEEGISNFVSLFKDNLLSDIESAEAAKTATEKAAIVEYEKKYGIKDGKLIDSSKPADLVPSATSSPEIKALQDQIAELTKSVQTVVGTVTTTQKQGSAKELFAASKLPEKWFNRLDVNSETPVADQIKNLQTEYTEIQQSIINGEVEKGTYKPNADGTPKDRTEEEWAKIMDGEGAAKENGTVDLGLSK